MQDIRRVIASLTVTLAISLVAFPSSATGQAVKNPDTYVGVGIGDWDTFDYAWAYDVVTYSVIANIYETLIVYDGVRTDRFLPRLATTVPSIQNGLISPDGRTYTFPIRQGVRFHDGTPMTAEDVAHSLQRFMIVDRDGGPSSLLLEPILGLSSTRQDGRLILRWADVQRAVQVRGTNVVVTLKEPFAPFLTIMAAWSSVVSKKWAIANGDWDGTEATLPKYNNLKREASPFFEKANGTGAFKLDRWDRAGRQLILVRNEGYWRPPARLARIVHRRIDEAGTRILMLKAGDADLIGISRRELPQIEGDPNIRIIDDLPLLVTSGLFFTFDIDTRGNPDAGSGRLDGNGIPANFFSDVRVRRGFAYAFDYSTYLADGFRNKATLVTGMIPPMMLGYNPRQPYYRYDREKAISEFKEAWGGQVWERGFRFTIVLGAGNVVAEVGSRILRDSLESLNSKFKIDIRVTTTATVRTAGRQQKLPLFWTGWAADYPDPHNFAFPFMHSDGFFPVLQRFRDEESNRLVMQALRETDRKKRQSLYHQIGQKYFELVPSIATHNTLGFRAQRSWLRGWYYNPAAFADWYTLYKQ